MGLPMPDHPFAQRNVSLFIAFRVLFNARWYYPVLAILFLDFGISLEQYALLNVAWAVSIVCLEVPAGALADKIGRKRMVVLAAALMVVELSLFAFAPRGASWLFGLFLLNRILSGAAEASASGADEALVYDSLVEAGREAEWGQVLTRMMRWQSAGFFVAMMLGAALYDPRSVQWLIASTGSTLSVSHEITMRFPIYLTLANALGALFVALRMTEPAPHAASGDPAESLLQGMLKAGRWIWHTPLALGVILAGLCFDSIIRLFLTLGSNFYRLIALPEAAFGLIGSSFAVVGFFTPRLAQYLVKHWSIRSNFILVSMLTLAGLVWVAMAVPIWGALLVIPLGAAMSLVGFFGSHYLNVLVADSSRRATVLSFKGLLFNLAYGAVGLMFAGLTHALRGAGSQDEVFAQALVWLPWY